jgi:hypothetical protein
MSGGFKNDPGLNSPNVNTNSDKPFSKTLGTGFNTLNSSINKTRMLSETPSDAR